MGGGHVVAAGSRGWRGVGLLLFVYVNFWVAEICRIFGKHGRALYRRGRTTGQWKPYSIPLAPRSPLYKNITVPVVDPY